MNSHSRSFHRPFWMNVDPAVVAAAQVAMDEAFYSVPDFNMGDRGRYAWSAFLVALGAENVPPKEQAVAGLTEFFAAQERERS